VASGGRLLSEPSPPPFFFTFCFPPSLLLPIFFHYSYSNFITVSLGIVLLHFSVLSVRCIQLFVIITSLFLFLALDIPSNIGHLPFAAQLFLFFSFLLSSFRVARSNSSHFPSVGCGGKLVGEGLGKGS